MIPLPLERSLVFQGNEVFTGERLRSLFEDHTGTGTPPGIGHDDMVTVILNYYEDRGYLAARVEKILVEENPEKEGQSYVFHLVEGQRYWVGNVTLAGNHSVSEEEIAGLLKTRDGSLYSGIGLKDDLQALENLYWNHGFKEAKITPVLTPVGPAKVDVELLFEEGRNLEEGDFSSMDVETLREVTRRSPGNGSAWRELGVALRKEGKESEAVRALRQACSIEPENAESLGALGAALAASGETKEAVSVLEKSISISPGTGMEWTLLGGLYYRLGRTEDAIVATRMATSLRPQDADAYSVLGASLILKGKLEEARAASLRAVELDSGNATAWNSLGVYHFRRKEWEPAIRCWQKATDVDPAFSEAWSNLGASMAEVGRLEESIEALRRSLELNPSNAIAWEKLGSALLRSNQSSQAEGALRHAVELDPEASFAWSNLGWSLFLQNRPESAVEALEKAVELKPDFHLAMNNLAKVCFEMGDVERGGAWAVRSAFTTATPEQAMDEDFIARSVVRKLKSLKIEIPCDPPSERLVREYLEQNRKTYAGQMAHVRMISSPKASTSREEVEKMYQTLKAGGDFALAARVHSDGPMASRGGDRGWVKRNELRADLSEAAFSLKAGELSQIIEDETHYRIIQVVEPAQDDKLPPLDVVKDEIAKKLLEETRAEMIQGWVRKAGKEVAVGNETNSPAHP